MAGILQSRRESIRFRILVEIAAHQPNVRQKEVAERLELTPPAISEYMKGLVADGLVLVDGRAGYSITGKGVEALRDGTAELNRYSRLVMKEVISPVPVWTALSETSINKGDRVSLEMHDGILYANKKEGTGTTGIAISDAFAGEDVGVSELKGLIRLDEGWIIVCEVPRVEMGGSRMVDGELLRAKILKSDMVFSMGIEPLVALRKAGIEPDAIFGAREAVVEAAFHGISSLIVCVNEQVPRVLDRLESEGLKYELVNLTLE